jgi:hypothetical protein
VKLTCNNCRHFTKIYKGKGNGDCSKLNKAANMQDSCMYVAYNDNVDRIEADIKEIEYNLKDYRRRLTLAKQRI